MGSAIFHCESEGRSTESITLTSQIFNIHEFVDGEV